MEQIKEGKKKNSTGLLNKLRFQLFNLLNVKKTILKQKAYLISFLVLSFFMTCFLLFFPGFLNPNTSVLMQLSILNISNYILLVILGLLISLLIVMQLYSYNNQGSASYTKTFLSGGSAFFASVVGTAGCASCVATVFAFLGFGASAFLIKYQLMVIAIAIIFVTVSIYFTSLKIKGECTTCRLA